MSKHLKLAPAIAAALAMAGAPAHGEEEEVTAAVAAVGESPVPEAVAEAIEPQAEGEPAAPAVAEAASPEADGLVAHLKSENKQLRQDLLDATLSARDAKNQLDELAAKAASDAISISELSAAVVQACTNMSVALNATLPGLSSMSPAQLKSTFDELRTSLTSRFSAGAKSVTGAVAAGPAYSGEEPTTVRKAALAATSINNKRA